MQVIGPPQPGQAVNQRHHIRGHTPARSRPAPWLARPGSRDMGVDPLIIGASQHFGLHIAAEVGHFFGALVDQQGDDPRFSGLAA